MLIGLPYVSCCGGALLPKNASISANNAILRLALAASVCERLLRLQHRVCVSGCSTDRVGEVYAGRAAAGLG